MTNWLKKIILIAIFLISSLLMVFSAKSDTVTTDEGVHLFAGYTYLTQHDFRLDPEHPPLIKEIAALPLLFLKPNVQLEADWEKAGAFYTDSWKEARNMGNQFLYMWENDANEIVFFGRMMMIILTMGLGLAVYFVTRKYYGETAGIFATFLTLFCPVVLAHGRLTNTDIGVTLFSFLAVIFWIEYLKSADGRKNWKNLILAGVFLGLALASKFTAGIFVVIFVALLIFRLFFKNACWWKLVLGFAGALIISFVIIWSTYGFKMHIPPQTNGGISAEIYNYSGAKITSKYDPIFEKVRPILFPADYLKGLSFVGRHVVSGHGSFLLGQNSDGGWWYYFPVAIFFKSSLALFIFLILSIISYAKTRTKDLFVDLALIIPPLLYLIISMMSRADLGVRHVLPIFPFLFVFSARCIKDIDLKKTHVYSIIFFVAAIWYLIVGFFAFPNYIAYFNEAAGGSKNGHNILTDSNLDWGQDLGRIKDYVEEKNLDVAYLIYPWDGDDALAYYGLKYPVLEPDNQNIKGNVIISATYYETDAYAWLKKYPMEEITPGVFLVKVN